VTDRFARLRPSGRRLTDTERLVLGVGVFLLVVAIAMFAGTLPPPAPVFVGIGLGWLLVQLDRWAGSRGG